MKVQTTVAQELLELFEIDDTTEEWDNFPLKFQLIQEELVDTSRWSHIHERIYKDLTTGKFYSTNYSTGATECQDERPYEYDGNEVEFTEVVPVEQTVVVYKAV